MDQFMEEVVTKRNRSAENILLGLAWVAMILSGLLAMFMFNMIIMSVSTQGFSSNLIFDVAITLIMLVACVFIFLFKDRIKTEYEYTFTNGILDFAKVFNNKKRKTMGTMNVRNVDAIGMVNSGSFKRYLSMPGLKRINWFLNRDAELFYMYFQKNNVKSLMVIEPSPQMRTLITKAAGQSKFQQN